MGGVVLKERLVRVMRLSHWLSWRGSPFLVEYALGAILSGPGIKVSVSNSVGLCN